MYKRNLLLHITQDKQTLPQLCHQKLPVPFINFSSWVKPAFLKQAIPTPCLALLWLSGPTWEQLVVCISLAKNCIATSHICFYLLFFFFGWITPRGHLLLCNATVVTCVVDPWFCNYPPKEMKRLGKPLKREEEEVLVSLCWHVNPVCMEEVLFNGVNLNTIEILTSYWYQ